MAKIHPGKAGCRPCAPISSAARVRRPRRRPEDGRADPALLRSRGRPIRPQKSPRNRRQSPLKNSKLALLFPSLSLGWPPSYKRAMDRIRIRGGHPLEGGNPHQRRQERRLEIDGGIFADRRAPEPGQCAAAGGCARHGRAADELRRVSIQVNMSPGLGEGDHHETSGARQITSVFASYDMVRKMRASFQVLAPLLARSARSQGLAARRLRHRRAPRGAAPESALEAMGAKIDLAEGYVTATAPGGLKGAEIVFPFVSVGATETAMMAASLATRHHQDRQCGARAGNFRPGKLPDRHGRENFRSGFQRDHQLKVSPVCMARTYQGDARPDRGRHLCHCRAAIAGGEVELVGASRRTPSPR